MKERIDLIIDASILRNNWKSRIKAIAYITDLFKDFGETQYVISLSKKYDVFKHEFLKYQEAYFKGVKINFTKNASLHTGYLRYENNSWILTEVAVYNHIRKEKISVYIPYHNKNLGSVQVDVKKRNSEFLLISEDLVQLPNQIFHICWRGKYWEAKKEGRAFLLESRNRIKSK